MATPYITPAMLLDAPTGISWDTIPNFNSSPHEQLAEQTNMCWRASHWMDAYCNQPLRATVDVEQFLGPNYRVTNDHSGLTRIVPSRWPVTEIIGIRVASARAFPVTWTDIKADNAYIENELTTMGAVSTESAAGPSSIMLAPGNVTWLAGRNGTRIEVTYVNGWAHAGMVASTPAGSNTITLDDLTGMTAGRGVWIYDGANTEPVVIASRSAESGPGTITTVSPTIFSHTGYPQQPIMVSALPAAIQQAAILHASYQALTRGALATTVQNMPGTTTNSGSPDALLNQVKDILKPYRRVL